MDQNGTVTFKKAVVTRGTKMKRRGLNTMYHIAVFIAEISKARRNCFLNESLALGNCLIVRFLVSPRLSYNDKVSSLLADYMWSVIIKIICGQIICGT